MAEAQGKVNESVAVAATPAPAAPEPAATPENSGLRDPSGQTVIDPATGRPLDEMQTGAHGMAFAGGGRERGGGAIEEELRPENPAADTFDPLRFERRYIRSKLYKEAGPAIARAPENIGFYGKGDTYHGTGLLVDIDSMKTVRVYDGWQFKDDRVFANSRDIPTSLVDGGDIAENLQPKAKE